MHKDFPKSRFFDDFKGFFKKYFQKLFSARNFSSILEGVYRVITATLINVNKISQSIHKYTLGNIIYMDNSFMIKCAEFP